MSLPQEVVTLRLEAVRQMLAAKPGDWIFADCIKHTKDEPRLMGAELAESGEWLLRVTDGSSASLKVGHVFSAVSHATSLTALYLYGAADDERHHTLLLSDGIDEESHAILSEYREAVRVAKEAQRRIERQVASQKLAEEISAPYEGAVQLQIDPDSKKVTISFGEHAMTVECREPEKADRRDDYVPQHLYINERKISQE